jgi:signal transduction histidine kinase
MVDDLLLLARIDAGQMQLERKPIEIGELLATCVARLEPRAAEKEVELALQIPPEGLPRVTGDGDRLMQLFANLMDNALKHTPVGSQVAVEGSGGQGRVHVTVSDTGPGIPADELPRIFERFYQVDKSRTRTPVEGVGLGLAIAQELANAHGGRITVDSVVGVGTRFTVILPAAGSPGTIARHSRR